MVIYDLICDSNHRFEGWFKNSQDMITQSQDGLLICPFCDSAVIKKQLTAPKLTRKSNATGADKPAVDQVPVNVHGLAVGSTEDIKESPEKFKQLQKMLGKVHRYIDQNFEDVGNRFSEEAISIKRGEKEASNIRGTATGEQIKEMADEGVDVLRLPAKPIDPKKIN